MLANSFAEIIIANVDNHTSTVNIWIMYAHCYYYYISQLESELRGEDFHSEVEESSNSWRVA